MADFYESVERMVTSSSNSYCIVSFLNVDDKINKVILNNFKVVHAPWLSLKSRQDYV